MIPLPTVVAMSLEAGINQVLALDPESQAKIRALAGKVVGIELRGVNIRLYLLPTANGLNLFSQFDGEPDTVLSGYPLSMARMGMVERPSNMLLSGEVQIRGNTELGQQVRDILDGLDLDWEEHLSRLTGDMLAHKVGDVLRGALAWSRKAVSTLSRDAAEYLQEESRDLPVRGEVGEFVAEVDTLRADMDRMEARVRRLQQTFAKNNNGNHPT